MTITEAHTDTIDAARDAADDIADETRSRAGQIRVAVVDAAGHVPEMLESARTGLNEWAGACRMLPTAPG